MDHEDGRVATEEHLERPNVARAFDLALGGVDHHAVDREFMAEVRTVYPGIDESCRNVRRFSRSVTAHLAGTGHDQFLELGGGLPTVDPVHAVAARHRAAGTSSAVVYVDIDPETTAHARRILDVDPTPGVRTAAICADVGVLGPLLADDVLRATLDLARPVVVVAAAVLSYLDDDTVAALVASLHAALAPGSVVAIAAPTGTARDDIVRWSRHDHRGLSYAPRLRSREQMAPWLAGWDVPAPGWCSAPDWRAGAVDVPGPDVTRSGYWGVVAVRP